MKRNCQKWNIECLLFLWKFVPVPLSARPWLPPPTLGQSALSAASGPHPGDGHVTGAGPIRGQYPGLAANQSTASPLPPVAMCLSSQIIWPLSVGRDGPGQRHWTQEIKIAITSAQWDSRRTIKIAFWQKAQKWPLPAILPAGRRRGETLR